jgi:hypothetical protein
MEGAGEDEAEASTQPTNKPPSHDLVEEETPFRSFKNSAKLFG